MFSPNARNQGAARAAAQRPTAPRAGAFETSQTRAIVAVFGCHEAQPTEVAAPTRGRAPRGLSLKTAKVRNRPLTHPPLPQPTHLHQRPHPFGIVARHLPIRVPQAVLEPDPQLSARRMRRTQTVGFSPAKGAERPVGGCLPRRQLLKEWRKITRIAFLPDAVA